MKRDRIGDVSLNINHQAWAVLHYLAGREPDFAEYKDGYYAIWLETAPWYNGRERGFVISMAKSIGGKAIHIAFFEHRNSDSICALRCVTSDFGMNPPTLQSHGEAFYPTDNKFDDIAFSVGPGEIGKMADWIYDQLKEHYQNS